MKIALLGAQSTGKTTLARELAAHFNATGRDAIAIPEALRDGCEREQRAPRPEEQMAIAREQEQRVDEAVSRGQVAIADTTALMVAIYGAVLFEDHPLYRFAIESQRGYDITLVTGLDLPWIADSLPHCDTQAQAAVDAQLRDLLGKAAIAHRVVYGSGKDRLRNALAAITPRPAPHRALRDWTWQCDKCSQPDCEHHLFTRLTASRS